MYFHLKDSIYLTYFQNEAIALDLQKDRYLILSKELSTFLEIILQHSFTKKEKEYVFSSRPNPMILDATKLNSYIQKLREENLISSKDFLEPFRRPINKNSASGLKHHEWIVPTLNFNEKVSFSLVLKAFFILSKVHIISKCFGLSSLVSYIKKKSIKLLKNKKNLSFSQMIKSVRLAYLFFPCKMKCLEWASTLVLLGLKQGKKCQLVIGVQRLPFIAHAWAEENHEVIGDAEDLPNQLAIIFREPSFSKESLV